MHTHTHTHAHTQKHIVCVSMTPFPFIAQRKATWCALLCVNMSRVGQNRTYSPYMTVYLVMFLPKIPYIHRIYMVGQP